MIYLSYKWLHPRYSWHSDVLHQGAVFVVHPDVAFMNSVQGRDQACEAKKEAAKADHDSRDQDRDANPGEGADHLSGPSLVILN